MTAPSDGGSAFPLGGHIDPNTRNFIETPNEGMSLRDWFAGQALAMIDREAVAATAESHGLPYEEVTARLAYTFAGAMIEERNREADE